MAKEKWTWEWPNEPGLYLAYGGYKGAPPRLTVCKCSLSSNGALAHTANGHFIFKQDGWRGVFQPFEVPAEAIELFDKGPPKDAD